MHYTTVLESGFLVNFDSFEYIPMTTLAEGLLVTNYHDGGRKISKSSLDRRRKQKRPLCQTAIDVWRG